MNRILPLFLLLTLLTACSPAVPLEEPPIVTHTYIVSSERILNPERGFFTPYILPGLAGFSPVRITGNTLVHLNIRLDDYRESDIPADVLAGLDTNFEDIRDAGVKAILRVAYNQGPYPDSEPDASKQWILRHIEQLQPLFQKHAGVIAWLEAGFIGAWGEWHTSTNGLDNLTDKSEILHALIAAVPGHYVQVRYPANIIEMYPDPQDAAAARVAHHNDCFLSSDTDVGTYERDGKNTIVRDQAYLADLTATTPMSGETCAPFPPRSECLSAIREMELLHFSALNEAYHKGILRSWQDGGCMEEITNRLGYRLALTEAQFNEQVRPGGLLNLTVSLTNTGFAALVNPRPVFIVLLGQAETHTVQLEVDPRTWQPGATSFGATLRLPSDMAEDSYTLAIWLPDDAENLREDPLYAVRFANENVWDEASGYNRLGQVTVDGDAPGGSQRTAAITVVELRVGDVTPLPTATPAAASEPAQAISGLEAASDSDLLILSFKFLGDPGGYNGFQIFLDTDRNPATGFDISGLGAEFLLENDTLNQYTGSRADWTWTPVETDVPHQIDGQTARWSVRLASLDISGGFDMAAQLVDTAWNTVFLTEPQHVELP